MFDNILSELDRTLLWQAFHTVALPFELSLLQSYAGRDKFRFVWEKIKELFGFGGSVS